MGRDPSLGAWALEDASPQRGGRSSFPPGRAKRKGVWGFLAIKNLQNLKSSPHPTKQGSRPPFIHIPLSSASFPLNWCLNLILNTEPHRRPLLLPQPTPCAAAPAPSEPSHGPKSKKQQQTEGRTEVTGPRAGEVGSEYRLPKEPSHPGLQGNDKKQTAGNPPAPAMGAQTAGRAGGSRVSPSTALAAHLRPLGPGGPLPAPAFPLAKSSVSKDIQKVP